MTLPSARITFLAFGLLLGSTAWIGAALGQLQAPGVTNAASVASVAYRPPPTEDRYLTFISDLHLGVGRRRDGTWDPTEDFRWPRALEGFLKRISEDGHERVDLVVVGDFLELWQPPPEIECKGLGFDLGCTLDEMGKLSELVVAAHPEEMGLLRRFAERGENRLHLIPGNHDSTLRYQRVWRPVGEALHADSGRIELVDSGIWSSPDGKIVAEHGHQIGLDENGYATWPDILRRRDQIDYVVRPWGELFVQRLFNEQEKIYEIIDNLMPESVGASFRAADRGRWGTAADIARFISFNLWETSAKQTIIFLGTDSTGKREWNIRVARNMGSDLFLNASKAGDPLRAQLAGDSDEVKAVRDELDKMARDPARLPDEAVLHLCDLSADNGDRLCMDVQLGAHAKYKLNSKDKILGRHLRNRQQHYRAIRTFIYGHTHQYEDAREVDLNGLLSVAVANTGAFQRLVDEPGFRRRLNGKSPEEGLRTMRLEQIAPCYGTITMSDENATPLVRAWHMPEDGVGEFVPPNDASCQ
jgi:UDP-2,3-diacylglucosamine pyrophosphatase LpxH